MVRERSLQENRQHSIRPSTAQGKHTKPTWQADRSYIHGQKKDNEFKTGHLKSIPKSSQLGFLLAQRIKLNDRRPVSCEDLEREKYTFTRSQPRPASAPNRIKHEISAILSPRDATRKRHRTSKSEDMFEVVKAAKEAKAFEEDAEYYHNIEKSIKEPEKDEQQKDAAPVFNKRLFASQGAVIITREARRLMSKNDLANRKCALDSVLTKTDVQCLRCVVDGLKLIHKGQDFVKDVLSKVVSYEMYKAFEYVPLKHWEDHLACYYILNGAVEVTYDLSAKKSRNVYQANIIYSHGTGEYLGLVSSEGPTEDLAPPATIYTKELTQFIRVDRQRFHKLMQQAIQCVESRKKQYINSHSFLTRISDDVKEKIIHKLAIQDFPANRVLLAQGDVTEHLFIIMTGRCQTYREVYIPEADKKVLFYLTSRDPDDFFGEECVLDSAPSVCSVVSATATTIMKLHRSALKMVQRDKLMSFIDELRHEIPTDEDLKDRGYRDSVWNKFKHTQIKGTLKEDGKLKYLSRSHSALVRERPPGDRELYIENMRRFVMKGSQFEPLRVRSADISGSAFRRRRLRRPHTSGGLITEAESASDGSDSSSENDSVDHAPVVPDLTSGEEQDEADTADKARAMEKRINKAMESKENLLKVLDEPEDLGVHLRQAWRAEGTQETNFMKNGVLVTMTSEDIVRKAKALADTYADKWKHGENENEEDWDTVLHAENKQAKMLISANKLRIKDLKRRLAELQKKRERDRQKRNPGRAKYFSDEESEEEEDTPKASSTLERDLLQDEEEHNNTSVKNIAKEIDESEKLTLFKNEVLLADNSDSITQSSEITDTNVDSITDPDVDIAQPVSSTNKPILTKDKRARVHFDELCNGQEEPHITETSY